MERLSSDVGGMRARLLLRSLWVFAIVLVVSWPIYILLIEFHPPRWSAALLVVLIGVVISAIARHALHSQVSIAFRKGDGLLLGEDGDLQSVPFDQILSVRRTTLFPFYLFTPRVVILRIRTGTPFARRVIFVPSDNADIDGLIDRIATLHP
jgi:hypothetical protein